MPQRIQLRRTKGWRKPEGAIVVSRPSKWGNPYLLGDVTRRFPSLSIEQCQGFVVSEFRDLINVVSVGGRAELVDTLPRRGAEGDRYVRTATYPSLDEIRAELAGHDLACWCALTEPCHADVLLELANSSSPGDASGETGGSGVVAADDPVAGSTPISPSVSPATGPRTEPNRKEDEVMRPAIWTCTIGHRNVDKDVLPSGSDLPMRRAVQAVFRDLTGADDEFVFSGWGQDYIPEAYTAVVDHRNLLDDPTHEAAWVEAREIVAHAVGDDPDTDDCRTEAAISALCELIWHTRRRTAAP